MTSGSKPTTTMLPVVMSSTADVQALSEQVRSLRAEVEQLTQEKGSLAADFNDNQLDRMRLLRELHEAQVELKSKRDELAVLLIRCGPQLAEVAANVEISKREQPKIDKLLDGLRFLWAAYTSCAADRATLTKDEARLRDHLDKMERELLNMTGLKQL